MPFPLPQPVLADGEAIVGLLVFIFTVVGWLVSLANNQNNPPQAAPKPQPARPQGDERIQNEIEVFLREVRGKKADAAPATAEPIVVVDEEPAQRESLREKLVQKRKAEVERKDREQARLDQLKYKHLQPHVGEHVGEHVEDHRRGITIEAVQPVVAPAPLASSLPDAMVPAAVPLAALGGLLSNRDRIREAVILNEILSPPKSRRR